MFFRLWLCYLIALWPCGLLALFLRGLVAFLFSQNWIVIIKAAVFFMFANPSDLERLRDVGRAGLVRRSILVSWYPSGLVNLIS